jgi:hypothetical protein
MPKFLAIGYGDRKGYDRTPKPLRDAAHAQDERLKKAGALMGMAGVPVQVRNHEAKNVCMENGPFMNAGLPVAGFAVIDALNMEEAIKMSTQVPCAVAFGVVEIWPLLQATAD